MAQGIDRYWFLTWTTYGQWLPGDPRGCVTRVRGASGPRFEHDIPGTPYDDDLPGLYRAAQLALVGPPVRLIAEQARVLLTQFQETAMHRRWLLVAVGIMAQHVHLVSGVPGDPKPTKILGDYKSYGSRALNKRWTRPESDTWWTESGSMRKLKNERAIFAAVEYTRNQEFALLIWVNRKRPR